MRAGLVASLLLVGCAERELVLLEPVDGQIIDSWDPVQIVIDSNDVPAIGGTNLPNGPHRFTFSCRHDLHDYGWTEITLDFQRPPP